MVFGLWSLVFENRKPKAKDRILSLRELKPLSRALLSVLLTFLLSRVSRNQARFLERRAKIGVEFHQRPRDAMTNRTGLSSRSAAIDIYQNVELARGIGQAERLTNDHPQSFIRKIGIERTPVDRYLARTRTQIDACCRSFSAARSVILNICHKKLVSSPLSQSPTSRPTGT